uniref:Uncharacterized protein n=1 Tax=Arundo donax TaxID=35708 RepID=A0A0A9A0V9_ARUDO
MPRFPLKTHAQQSHWQQKIAGLDSIDRLDIIVILYHVNKSSTDPCMNHLVVTLANIVL